MGTSMLRNVGIGALGGASLALLKLIDAKFFLDDTPRIIAVVSYLTYVAYVILGAVASVFLTDQGQPPDKAMRSSFVAGLLAPSLLLAIVTGQPVRLPTNEPPAKIQRLSGLFVPSAYAEEPAPLLRNAVVVKPKEIQLDKSDLSPKFSDALLVAFGRRQVVEPYVFVVGATNDKRKAVDVAKGINVLLLADKTNEKLEAKIVKPKGIPQYFVMVGNIGSPGEVAAIKSAVTAKAVLAIKRTPTPETKQAAERLFSAQVVEARAMFVK